MESLNQNPNLDSSNPQFHPGLRPFKTGRVSPGNGLDEEGANKANEYLKMGAEDKVDELEIKKEDIENKTYLIEMIKSMVLKYQSKLHKVNVAEKEKTLDAIANDMGLAVISAKNKRMEGDKDISKLITKLGSIKEYIENSR